MIAATLFSGIGAPEEAMPHWDWRWCAEIEKFPCAVLAQRHPHSVNLGDVSAHDFTERAEAIAKPDVLVFGSPCQSFSVAGQRLGLDDPRGNLALVALGIVDRLKPRWFVFENVPGLMSSSSGSDFGLFLRTVDELGYCCAWSVLDAQFFGVAQRRERVFVVGHLGADWRSPAAVLLEPESVRGHHPPRREARQRVAPTISARTSAGGGLGTDHDINGGLITSHDVSQTLLGKSNSSHRADAESYVAGTVSSKWSKGTGGPAGDECQNFVTHSLRADGFDASEDGTGRGTPLVPVAYSAMPMNSGKDFVVRETEISQPLMAAGPGMGDQGGDYVVQPVAVDLRNGTQDEVAMALQSGGMGDERGRCINAIPHTMVEPIVFRSNASFAETGFDVAGTLNSENQHAVAHTIAFTAKDHGADAVQDLSPTLRAGGSTGSNANAGVMPAVAFDARQSDVLLYGDKTGPLDTDGTSIAVAFDMRGREGGAQFEGPHETANIRAASGGSSKSYVAQAFDITGTGPGTINAANPTDVHTSLRSRAPGHSEGSTTTVVAQAFMENVRGELRVSEQTDSLTGGGGKPGQGYQAALIERNEAWAVRRLTPRECERLQGFPDDFTLITYRGKPAADGPRYKALGNSMAVPVVRWILQRIEHLEGT
jgi:DNA (cytosine-5)-methyltransferase 1